MQFLKTGLDAFTSGGVQGVSDKAKEMASQGVDKLTERVGPGGIRDLLNQAGKQAVSKGFEQFGLHRLGPGGEQPQSFRDPNRISLGSFAGSSLPGSDQAKNFFGSIANVIPGVNTGQIEKEDYLWVPSETGKQKFGQAFAGDIGGGRQGWMEINNQNPNLLNQRGDFLFDWNAFNIRNAVKNGVVPGVDLRKAIGGAVDIGKQVGAMVK